MWSARSGFVNTCPGYSGTSVLDPLPNAPWHPGEARSPRCTPEGTCPLLLARNYLNKSLIYLPPSLGLFPTFKKKKKKNQSPSCVRLSGSGHFFFSAAAPDPGGDTAGWPGWSPSSGSCLRFWSCFAICHRQTVSRPSHFCTCARVVRFRQMDRIDVVYTGL